MTGDPARTPNASPRVTAVASPSLALVKYWGKAPGGVNLPATPSLAVTLGGLRTTTRVTASSEGDEVVIGGARQPLGPYLPVFDAIRSRRLNVDPGTAHVRVESENDFPTAAGIASSSSGFAALTIALDAFFRTGLSRAELSHIARIGSGSAARAVYGGFTIWPEHATAAEPFLPADHWPELRVVVALLAETAKPISSRAGMETTRTTSPIYEQWCRTAPELYERACTALRDRDLERLGEAMRESYLFMFSTMFTTRPPIFYWLPSSVAVLRTAAELRASGVPVWETMDAGPQVKLVTLATHVSEVIGAIESAVGGEGSGAMAHEAPMVRCFVSSPGGEPSVEIDAEDGR